jgi:hypothetical protein
MLSRPRRWLRCLPIVPAGLRCAARVRTIMSKEDPPSLPVLLRWLERRVEPGAWDPTACLAVSRRLAKAGPEGPCLQRSLLLFALLHGSRAQKVRFVLGIHRTNRAEGRPPSPDSLPVPSPLAHAWVEADGDALGEGPDVVQHHRTLYAHCTTIAP